MEKDLTSSRYKFVFATNNAHKLKEIRQIMDGRIEVVSLRDIGCHVDIPETADTLEGNALLKARYVAQHYGLDCFADDTGLEVAALNGAPGVFSARYAAINADDKSNHQGSESQVGLNGRVATEVDEANMNLLLHNLEKKSDRSARFRTVIALIIKGEEHLFEGIVTGKILTAQHGKDGFGYDPIFQPDGYDQSFAEMSADQKNAISHRGRAMQRLAEFLKNYNPSIQ